MISDFEAGMKCLQNPSSISQFFSFPGILLKWGAVIIAILATFSSIFKRIKLILIRVHTVKPSSMHQNEEITEFSEDDDVSLASSDDEQEEGEKNSPTTSFRRHDEDFCVKGSQNVHLRQRRRRSGGGAWSEFTSGKSVVKLWDSLGLSLDFDEDLINYGSNDVVSLWDYDQGQEEYSGGVWNIPAVVMTAESDGKGDGVVLGGYDTRMRSRVHSLYGEWRSPAAEGVAGIENGGGVSKVYVRDEVNGVVTVGDVRNMRMPLGSVRESDGDTWWDADAVIVENE
ncbi:hypothetical protein BUALT_Bualt17G0099300 [Buddleja alternifolia]|uniref:Uncharacterized protein n=1 Tax=Buddleja alternifolia TaxID=168488 RepID=A0AAV6W599_9LAMI|nr:hypothetical protein BUALT_Bualt17G0099300 [Buddleja alternifolia]